MNRLAFLLVFFILNTLTACSSTDPSPVYGQVGDQIVIEAEVWSSTVDGASMVWVRADRDSNQAASIANRPVESNTKELNSDALPIASYSIEFNEAGLFYLWARGKLHGDSKAARLSFGYSDGTVQKTQHLTGFDNEWQWVSVDENQNILSVEVRTPGMLSFDIESASTNFLLDRLVLTKKPEFIPIGAGPESTILLFDTADSDNAAFANYPHENHQSDPVAGITPDIPANVDTAADSENNNQPPHVEILNFELGETFAKAGHPLQLQIITSDDGLPAGNVYTYWTQVTGPGEVSFSDKTAANPAVTFETAGTYQLQVSANDTELYKNAIVTIEVATSAASVPATSTVELASDQDSLTTNEIPHIEDRSGSLLLNSSPVNQPPSVSITGANTTRMGQALELTAVTTDDGLPTDKVNHFWNLVQGPGLATFSDVHAQRTSVTFSHPGQYVLQVSASDIASYANAAIEVNVDNIEAANNSYLNLDDRSQQNLTERAGDQWHPVFAQGSPDQRHETSGVVVDGKLYIIGGRGNKPVDVYDPVANTWSKATPPPIEMHHFQAVAIGHIIYVVGASTCCFPVEQNIGNVYQFDTRSGHWSKGAAIPGHRQRGSTAAATYNNKIYIVGGNTKGHSGGAVNWFDEFNPRTGAWRTLADAPDARDHSSVAIVRDQLVLAGGRRSSFPDTFGHTVARTNVYDFKQQRWIHAANIPTQRAGTMTVAVGDEVVVIGGESKSTSKAHNSVEAFNVTNGQWRQLGSLPTARHGGAAGVINGRIHVVAGSMMRGGGPETTAHEVLK